MILTQALIDEFVAAGRNAAGDSCESLLDGLVRVGSRSSKRSLHLSVWHGPPSLSPPGHMFNDLVDADPLDAHRALLDVVPSADMTYMGAMLPDTFDPELSNAGHPRSVPPTLRSRVAGALIAPYG